MARVPLPSGPIATRRPRSAFIWTGSGRPRQKIQRGSYEIVPRDRISGESFAVVRPPETNPTLTPEAGSFRRLRFSTLPADGTSFRSTPSFASAARYFSPCSRKAPPSGPVDITTWRGGSGRPTAKNIHTRQAAATDTARTNGRYGWRRRNSFTRISVPAVYLPSGGGSKTFTGSVTVLSRIPIRPFPTSRRGRDAGDRVADGSRHLHRHGEEVAPEDGADDGHGLDDLVERRQRMREDHQIQGLVQEVDRSGRRHRDRRRHQRRPPGSKPSLPPVLLRA